MAREQLTWTEIDTDNLSPELADAYKAMNDAKVIFEGKMLSALRTRGTVGVNQSALFTYRRGLAFAVVEKRTASTKVTL